MCSLLPRDINGLTRANMVHKYTVRFGTKNEEIIPSYFVFFSGINVF